MQKYLKGGNYLFDQDYIMRLIKDMVRMLLKLLFNIDTESPVTEQLSDEAVQVYESLLDLIDQGNINEAENQIYELIEDRSMEHLQMALLFFDYLSSKSDEFLQEHNFSRNEIKEDLKDIVSKYGLDGMVESFLIDT